MQNRKTFLGTNERFVNVVKDSLLYEETKLLKIFRWSCHFEINPKPLTFTVKEISDFIKVDADESESEESCKTVLNAVKAELKERDNFLREIQNLNIKFYHPMVH